MAGAVLLAAAGPALAAAGAGRRAALARLLVHVDPETDYWSRTHYGFAPHNGHFLHLSDVCGDFCAATTVTPRPASRFDQAGIMVRLSESCWLKASVEHGGPGRPSQLGVVVTNAGFSDWSTQDVPDSVGTLALRVRREGSDYIVEACQPAAPGGAAADAAAGCAAVRVGSGAAGSPAAEWTQLRICHLVEDVSPAGVGRDGQANVAYGEELAAACAGLPMGGVEPRAARTRRAAAAKPTAPLSWAMAAAAAPSEAARLARHDLDLECRQEYLFELPACLWRPLARTLEDDRDAPALLLLANVVATVVPAAVALHLLLPSLPPGAAHALGAAYLGTTYALFLQRFLLTLHFTQHRRLCKHGALNAVAPYLLAPLFGVPCGAYRLHHVVMHHVEDNADGWDLSSTERFSRDSPLSFLRYWLRFALASGVELPLYAARRGRVADAARAAASMAAGWAAAAALWARCPAATLYTLLLPYALSSLALMFGNWSAGRWPAPRRGQRRAGQPAHGARGPPTRRRAATPLRRHRSQHVFVDPSAPRDDYRLTYNCLACPDNARTFNDGYHILHHANSRLHWSELPAAFLQQLALHDERDALVFRGVGFFDVGLAVFTGRLGWLADRVVPCGPRQAARSREEWVALLRRRLEPVPPPGAAAKAAPRPARRRDSRPITVRYRRAAPRPPSCPAAHAFRAQQMRALTVAPLALALLALAVTQSAAQGDTATVFGWMAKNRPLFTAMVQSLGITPQSFPQNTVGTVLAPSDEAITAFLSRMGLTRSQFLARKQLVDGVVAFHWIPGFQAVNVDSVPRNPTVALTADVNYILRFWKNATGGPGGAPKVWVEDSQGNNVTLTTKPVLIKRVSILPIDAVLMSGGYFTSGLGALEFYPQWSAAAALAEAAGWPAGKSGDVTMFVPENAALTAARRAQWASMPAAQKREELLYHFVKGARSVPDSLKSGSLPTLLEGHSLGIAVTPAAAKGGVPLVRVTPEVGPAANVTIFNIWAGQAVLQGVSGSLQPKLPAAGAGAAKPAAGGRRRLLRGGYGRGYNGGGNRGFNQMTANSIAATNTQYAIEAAANGDIPVGAATAVGANQAYLASAYGANGCYNCRDWGRNAVWG
ncbi:REE1 [Scenedesmus sp. PABB004]|nr:REE1 [Scenedesmus sp. PABB004]